MREQRALRPVGWRVVAALAVAAMTVTACSGTQAQDGEGVTSGAGGAEGDQGVPKEASDDDWLVAFENVDPVTLNVQTPGAEGSVTSVLYEKYFAAIEDRSGGAITFDISFANAIADILEWDDAVVDQRLDMGIAFPVYDPGNYPVNAALGDASFIGDQRPTVNPLQIHAAMNEVALDRPDAIAEFEDRGLHVLLPWFSGDANGIFCTEPRSSEGDFAGAQAVAAGRVNSQELEGLGATPVSMSFTELFEGLQRGAVDCTLNSMRVADLQGLPPVAPHFTIDHEVGHAKTPGAFVINAELWESLPLVARQLMFDELEGFLQENIEGSTGAQVAGLRQLESLDGGIVALEDESRTALRSAHDEALDNIVNDEMVADGATLVSELQSSTDRWAAEVREGLGLAGPDRYDELVAWYDEHGFDLTEYAGLVFDEVLAARRPS